MDGGWWPNLTSPSPYCGMSYIAKPPRSKWHVVSVASVVGLVCLDRAYIYEVYHGHTMRYGDGMAWGRENISCIRPENELSTLFYATSNQMQVAFSLAEGSNPEFNTSEVFIYEAIEKSSIVFEVSFSTIRETVSHVSNCEAFGVDGKAFESRYSTLVPNADYGTGYLMLSIEDILAAAGRSMEDLGSERAALRLSGLEIVARVDVRNYHRLFSWPLRAWNPWGLPEASQVDCSVHFNVLRDQFNVVRLGRASTPLANAT